VLPDFPWPPPASSASYVLPKRLFEGKDTLGQVSNEILGALEKSGYVERRFFRTQVDGVALVTRLERINEDGTPVEETTRFPAGFTSYQSDLINFLRGLFYVAPGRYRVIVFVMQDTPFTQSEKKVTGDEARSWLKTGANDLPKDVAERAFRDGTVTALVYEFASDGTVVRIVESNVTGRQHLERAGLLTALGSVN
jgi:hypothetical protein